MHTKWHKEKRVETENVLRHPTDGETWKHFDKEFHCSTEDQFVHVICIMMLALIFGRLPGCAGEEPSMKQELSGARRT